MRAADRRDVADQELLISAAVAPDRSPRAGALLSAKVADQSLSKHGLDPVEVSEAILPLVTARGSDSCARTIPQPEPITAMGHRAHSRVRYRRRLKST